MRYSLRTLLILTILGPPALAWSWMIGAKALAEYRQRQQPGPHLRQMGLALHNYSGDSLWTRLPDGRPSYMAGVPLESPLRDQTDE